MALTEQLIERLIERHGEFVYHHTDPKAIKSVASGEALRPGSKDDHGKWVAKARPRSGCVYLRLPVEKQASGLEPRSIVRSYPLRIPWSALTPSDRIVIDEDTVMSWVEGNDRMCLPPFTDDFANPPNELLMPPGETVSAEWAGQQVERSWGEWVDHVNRDSPENVYASACRGAIGFRGSIPAEAITIQGRGARGVA